MVPRISVVINTLNEEANLPFVLRSVRSWVDEIIVVDMHSEDRTAEVARAFGAQVHLHEKTGVVEAARNTAIGYATGDWILVMDADEIVPWQLSRTLLTIARNDLADVVVIPWVNYLLGSPLLHTGWGPEQDRHPRFFKAGRLRPSELIHGRSDPISGARVMQLRHDRDGAVAHFTYVDVAHFIERLNRYTTAEALQARERGESAGGWGTLVRAGREFLARYLRHRGYRDGWRGFYLSLMMAFYRCARDAKLVELRETGGLAEVEAAYRSEALRLVEVYESDQCRKRDERLIGAGEGESGSSR